LQEINSSVSQMDQMTQQNAAMVEESTAVTHNLSAEANTLSQLIEQFRVPSQVAGGKPSAISDASKAIAPADSPARSMIRSVARAIGG
jgi:methyl-accepting chemotaxis protein